MAANVDKLDERTSSTNKQPIPSHRLEEIANSVSIHSKAMDQELTAIQICDSTFESVTEYEHSRTESWNSNIIVNLTSTRHFENLVTNIARTTHSSHLSLRSLLPPNLRFTNLQSLVR